jgi:hypothetical protein
MTIGPTHHPNLPKTNLLFKQSFSLKKYVLSMLHRCMDKEKVTKDVVVRVQPSLFKQFKKKCKNNYKTISEVVRDLMVGYIKKDN